MAGQPGITTTASTTTASSAHQVRARRTRGLRLVTPTEGSLALARALEPRLWPRLRLLVDAVVLFSAAAAAALGAPSPDLSVSNWIIAGAFPLLVLLLLQGRQRPDERLSPSSFDTFVSSVGVISLAVMLTISVEVILGAAHPLTLALRLWVFAIVYLGFARIVLHSVRQHAFHTPGFSTPTLIVGAGVVGEQLSERLMADRSYGLRPVGLIDPDPLGGARRASQASVPLLGGIENLLDVVEATGARQIVLAFSTVPDRLLIEKMEQCRRRGVGVMLVPRLYELINERSVLDHVGGLPVVSLRATDPHSFEFTLKHVLDRVLAAIGLLALAPLMLILSFLIVLSSPGPVLFRQRRVGRDGKVFDLLKFRTMSGAPGDGFDPGDGLAPGGVEGTDRRTGLGRLLRRCSLDELPQLINVLKGDMSLVGPRPERPEFVARFVTEVPRYDRRHRVKSGITGWAQIRGLRGQTSIADRVEWDNFYIQNWSLLLDLRIIALTVVEVLRLRG